MVVTLSKDAKVAYDIFKWLRQQFSNANICTLRHISAYIARTYDAIDINRDIKIIMSLDMTMCSLLLSDGSEFRFVNDGNKEPCFVVGKSNGQIDMMFVVTMLEKDNLSKPSVIGKVVSGDWYYIVDSNSYDNNKNVINVYYKNEFVSDGTSYFDKFVDDNIGLDCIDGLGYLTDVMVRINLLYNNLIRVNNNRLVRKIN